MDFLSGCNHTAVRMIRLCSIIYVFVFVASSAVVTETAKGTPPVVPDHVKTKYVVQEGTKNWKLTCAAEGERPLLITWTKDGESITSAWPRFKQTNDAKDLKIKNVAIEDSGAYRCRAVNGFGSVDVEYTVVVVGKNEPFSANSNDYTYDEFVPPDVIDSSLPEAAASGGTNRAPFWVDGDPSTANAQTALVRPVGGNVKMRCHATGHPKPDIIWMKDGKELDDAVFSWSRGKWALHLRDLRESDSGMYTCRVFNIWGSLNASFVVKVTNGDPSLPEFEKSHPLNTTVNEGQSATFHCRVRSIEKPIIQWIKVIEDPSHLEFNQSVEVHGLHITVLDKKYPSEVEDFRNATWLKRLTIPSVAAQDAGWYVCVVTSQKGHLSHRFAYLQVVPVYQQVPINDQMPLHIVIGIPVAFILLLLVGYAIYFLQKHQQKPTANGALNGSNGQRPPPPPSYPPPSLPNSSVLKASPYRAGTLTTSNGHHHYGAGSTSDQLQSIMPHQNQPLLHAKDNTYLIGQPPPPAPPASMYKADFKKTYHLHHFHQTCIDLDPQAATPLNGSECDGVYETTNTPQPYELRYDDESDFSDGYDEHAGSGRIQHYPSLYSCR